MPVYPNYVQAFVNNKQVAPLVNPEKVIDSYYNTLALANQPDTQENFKLCVLPYLDGHAEGYKQGYGIGYESGYVQGSEGRKS